MLGYGGSKIVCVNTVRVQYVNGVDSVCTVCAQCVQCVLRDEVVEEDGLYVRV